MRQLEAEQRAYPLAGGAAVAAVQSFPEWIVRLAILSLFLTPAIRLVPRLPAMRFDQLLVLAATTWAVLAARRAVVVVWSTRAKLILALVVLIPVSMLVGSIMGYPASILDGWDMVRVGTYLAFYLITLSVVAVAVDPDAARLQIVRTISLASLALSPIVLQQYLNLFGLNSRYVQAIAPTHSGSLAGASPRAVGMVGNPNELGFMFALATLATLHVIVNDRRHRGRYAVVLLVDIACLLATVSRSSFGALVVGILVYVAFGFIGAGRRRQLLPLAVGALLVAGAIAVAFTNQAIHQSITWRFDSQYYTEQSAWEARLANWQQNEALFEASPVFGVGSLAHSGFIQFSADNEWLLILRSQGAVGAIVVLLVLLVPAVQRRTPRWTRPLAASLGLSAIIYMIPAAAVASPVLMPVFLILAGACDQPNKTASLSQLQRAGSTPMPTALRPGRA